MSIPLTPVAKTPQTRVRPYLSETYKGVEIRTRCAPLPRGYLWCGSYSFFTRTYGRQGNDRICRELDEKFSSEGAAAAACFAAAHLAVDREIRSMDLVKQAPLRPVASALVPSTRRDNR